MMPTCAKCKVYLRRLTENSPDEVMCPIVGINVREDDEACAEIDPHDEARSDER